MATIGILAYGSLIEDPGTELEPLIIKLQERIQTPFRIEFARSSQSRDGAPTVIPVENAGARVWAQILILRASVTLENAEDLLWRRETRKKDSDKHYSRPQNPGCNDVLVERLEHFGGVDVVIYTKLGSNISDCSPANLARLAIESAQNAAGRNGEDGITYLMSLKRQGISTPLMPFYEAEILRVLNTNSLEAAREKCLRNGE